MDTKNFKRFIILGLCISFLIASIAKTYTVYADKDKSFKMIYKLQDGESCMDVARRFGVKVEDMKLDGRYVMLEVK